jgi:hypothetical protein
MSNLKRGIVRCDGMIFWCFRKKRDGSVREQWLTIHDFEDRKRKEFERNRSRKSDDQSRARARELYQKNKDAEALRSRLRRSQNIERARDISRRSQRKRYSLHCDSILSQQKEAYRARSEEQKERDRKRARDRYKKNPRAYLDRVKAWMASKGPIARVIANSRTRIKQALREAKTDKSLKYIGCSADALRIHLESQFKDGMSWENYGYRGWHIDHIVPLCSASTEEELIPLLHYSNLQPLWGVENMRKGGRLGFGLANQEEA